VTTLAVIGSLWVAEPLRRALPEDTVVSLEDRVPLERASDAEAAVGWPNAERFGALLDLAPRLRWVHTLSAGVERLMIPQVVERDDLVVTNNSGAFDVPIGEHVLALVLAAAKRLRTYVAQQTRREWKEHAHAEVRGATLVVLGLGSIGAEVARLGAAVGMRVIGIRRRPEIAAVPGVDRIVGPERMPEVAAEADYLVVATPLTAATRGLVSRDVIARLRPTAWVINIARGAVIDEAALLEACRAGRIGGAALDAWWEEPLPADSQWWSLENVIVTPHASNSSPRLRERSLTLLLENVGRFKRGEPLLNVVDKREGY
jgi:phosphoglycerate dehydrogenase-like enzyme